MQLRPIVTTSSAEPAEPVKLSPLLWPLAAYLAIGTILLFGVSQLNRFATTVMPWEAKSHRWHEGSAGWMALYPVTLPFLVVHALVLLVIAIPARLVASIARAVANAWRAVRSAITRVRAAIALALRDALRAVRQAAETTVRRMRAVLARIFSIRE